MEKLNIKTAKREILIDITSEIQQIIAQSSIQEGICVIYCPHTTGAITINEAYDPSVQDDFIFAINKLVPKHREFKHAEGNSDSHTKTSLTGPSQSLIISAGKLLLGRWQGIYFAEFDGPRAREIWVQIVGK